MRLKCVMPLCGAVLILSAAPVFLSAKKNPSSNSGPGSPESNAGAPPAATPKSPSAQAKHPAKRRSRRHSRRRHRARGQKAPTKERIQEIQAALALAGSYKGQPNGKWDARSVEAMKRFQEAQGLKPTGKLDALSLQKLGLGSQVVGLAAPRPPAQNGSGPSPRPSENPPSASVRP